MPLSPCCCYRKRCLIDSLAEQETATGEAIMLNLLLIVLGLVTGFRVDSPPSEIVRVQVSVAARGRGRANHERGRERPYPDS